MKITIRIIPEQIADPEFEWIPEANVIVNCYRRPAEHHWNGKGNCLPAEEATQPASFARLPCYQENICGSSRASEMWAAPYGQTE